jgi:hypothetical protein
MAFWAYDRVNTPLPGEYHKGQWVHCGSPFVIGCDWLRTMIWKFDS